MKSDLISVVRKSYYQAIYDTDRDLAFQVIHQAIEAGISPESIVFDVIVPAIDEMVESFTEHYDASIAQHFMATEIAAAITEEMLTKFSQQPKITGKVVLGASFGDFHGLGKRIVAGCLKTQMLEVIDLGVNVTAEKFVEAAQEHNAQVIGIAAMMVHTATSDKGSLGVRRLLQQSKLESAIKIVVGGAPYRFDPELYKQVQADAWARNGIEAGKIIKNLIEQVNAEKKS